MNNMSNRPRSMCDHQLLSVDRKYRDSWPSLAAATSVNGHINTSWNKRQEQQVQPFGDGTVKYPTSPPGALAKAPSMAGLVNTTVPQRLVNRPLRGQHTPTRSSLRHSRMICLSQQGKVPRKYLPPVMHHYRMGTSLVLIQLLLASLLMGIALYLLISMPVLNTRDVPHWSATTLMLSSVFGLFLMFCCRKQYPGMQGGCCVFVVRVQYIVCNLILALVATTACLCACIFASVHVSELLQMQCGVNPDIDSLWQVTDGQVAGWNASCVCRAGDSDELYTYDPLSCHQVERLLPIFLMASAVCNGVACFVCAWYVLLLWSNRFAYAYAANYYDESAKPISGSTRPARNANDAANQSSCQPFSCLLS